MGTESALSPEEEAQKEDERLLAENKRKIEEILKLIDDGTDQDSTLARVNEAQGRVDTHYQGKVFHPHQGRRIALSGHTSNTLLLAEALEMHLRTRRHGADLHKSLSNLSRQRVRLLQRVLQRGLF
jgi:hypothetical protein